MEITIFAFPVLIAGLLIKSTDKLVLVFLICFIFGGTATFSLSTLGGAPILPAVLFLPFVVWQAQRIHFYEDDRRIILDSSSPDFWLFTLIFYEVLSAIILPRFFEGETMVYAANRGAFAGVILMPLKTVSTNLTQSVYSILGLIAFIAMRLLLETPRHLEMFAQGVLIVGLINMLTAVIQLGETYLGLPPILTFFRNAEYAMFSNYEVAGLMRIQGTFPEASGYSAFTLPLFAFTVSLFRQDVFPRFSGPLSIGILILLLISTSTTAYFGLAMFASGSFLMFLIELFYKPAFVKFGTLSIVIWALMVLICLLLLLNSEVLTGVIQFFDVTVFNKLESSSGKERSAWNWQGLTNLVDTYGIGVGFGSNRSSNFFVALLSNVGLVGTALFAVFLGKILCFQSDRSLNLCRQINHAAKNAMLISLVSLFAGAPFAEPGMMFYVFAAAAVGGARETEIDSPESDSKTIIGNI